VATALYACLFPLSLLLFFYFFLHVISISFPARIDIELAGKPGIKIFSFIKFNLLFSAAHVLNFHISFIVLKLTITIFKLKSS